MAKGCLKFGLIGKISPNLGTLVTKQTLELIEKKKNTSRALFGAATMDSNTKYANMKEESSRGKDHSSEKEKNKYAFHQRTLTIGGRITVQLVSSLT